METPQLETTDNFEVQVTSTTVQHRTRSISIKLMAPLNMFTLTDALTQHGAVQSLEEFLIQRVRGEIVDYLAKAQEFIARAADKTRQKTPGK
jgi:hypothetical protein